MIPKHQGVEALLVGILIALVSSAIVLGGFALALQENLPPSQGTTLTAAATENAPAYQPTPTYVPETLNPTSIAITLPPESPGTITPIPSRTVVPTTSVTIPPQATQCPPPAGWIAIVINPGDTLTDLAQIYGSTPEALAIANCLVVDTLMPGTLLYVPVISPSVTTTLIACGPPPGWVFYTVQPGDTLYRLSQVFGVSVWKIQLANCLGSSTTIRTGQQLSVPHWLPIYTPVIIGTLTATATPTLMDTPFPTGTVSPPTSVPSASPTQTLTPSSTETIPPTSTSKPTASPTPSPTCTPTPTNIPTETPLPTDIPTDQPTPSQTPKPGESY